MLDPVHVQRVRVLRVVPGERADPVGGQELRLVQHVAQHAAEPISAHEGEEAARGAVGAAFPDEVIAEIRAASW